MMEYIKFTRKRDGRTCLPAISIRANGEFGVNAACCDKYLKKDGYVGFCVKGDRREI